MRILLLLSLALIPFDLGAQTSPPAAQTPPPAAQTPPPAAPAAPRPRAPARTALVVTVTDSTGATLPGIHVEVLGAANRSGDTNESGTLRFANMRAGTYRIRFSGDAVVSFEREVVVRAGQTADVDVTLNRAPAAPEPEPAAPAAAPAPAPASAPAVGPKGEQKLVSILDLLEKEFIGRQPRRETLLGCSGNARAMMVQLNEQQPERLYDTAEALYYVLGGEGTIRLDGRESALVTGHFALVPRGTSHGFIRKGRRPLILLAIVSGEACQGSTP